MTETGSIICETPGAGNRVGPLPVKIRTADGEIVGAGVSGSPIDVPPGQYFVSIMTPDGRERGFGEAVTVRAGENTVPALPHLRSVAPTSAAPPTPSGAAGGASKMAPPPADLGNFAGSAGRAASALPLQADPPSAGQADLPPGETRTASLWQGDWFAAWDAPKSPYPNLESGLGATLTLSENRPIEISRVAHLDQLIALPLGDCVRYSVVPYDECTACFDDTPDLKEIAVGLTPGNNGPYVRFRSTVAEETNTLLSFVDNGVLTEMWTVSEDMVNQGEMAMYAAGGSILRAVTGAYVLLRANELSGLDAWLRTLAGFAPELPDIPILHAELLARLGQHDDALALLDTAINGRCPWFRSGLSYMIERVRLYIDVSANGDVDFGITEAEMPRFVAARKRLDLLMRVLVRSRVLTTFDVPHSGLDCA